MGWRWSKVFVSMKHKINDKNRQMTLPNMRSLALLCNDMYTVISIRSKNVNEI